LLKNQGRKGVIGFPGTGTNYGKILGKFIFIFIIKLQKKFKDRLVGTKHSVGSGLQQILNIVKDRTARIR